MINFVLENFNINKNCSIRIWYSFSKKEEIFLPIKNVTVSSCVRKRQAPILRKIEFNLIRISYIKYDDKHLNQ